jgi:hypothetical protein
MPLLVNSSPFRVALRIYGSAQGASWDVRRGSRLSPDFYFWGSGWPALPYQKHQSYGWIMVNVLYHIIPYCIILCRIVPYYTMLNHIIPYYTTSYHTIPYYTILYHYTYHCTFLYLSLWYYSYHVPYQRFNGDRGHRILPCFDHGACCILLWIWLIKQWEPVLYWYNYIQPETMFQNSFQVDFITSNLGWFWYCEISRG